MKEHDMEILDVDDDPNERKEIHCKLKLAF